MNCSGFAFWWIFPLAFGSLWLLAIIFGARRWSRFGWGQRGWGYPDATEVLKERFARGDIDADEYQQRLRVIRGQ
jgi:uncharacterized membrane protein